MNKKLTLLAVIFVVGFAQGQLANRFGTGLAGTKKPVPVSFASYTLKSTTFVSDFSGAVMAPETFTPVDSVNTLYCSGTSGNCLIQAEQWVEFGGNGTSDNGTEICLFVDGALTNEACYFAGELNTGYYDNQLSTSQVTPVTPGGHTVQTQVFSIKGGDVGFYNIVYRIYKR